MTEFNGPESPPAPPRGTRWTRDAVDAGPPARRGPRHGVAVPRRATRDARRARLPARADRTAVDGVATGPRAAWTTRRLVNLGLARLRISNFRCRVGALPQRPASRSRTSYHRRCVLPLFEHEP